MRGDSFKDMFGSDYYSSSSEPAPPLANPVPPGVIFSNQVLLLPYLYDTFAPVLLKSDKVGSLPSWGAWINRGESLLSYTAKKSILGSEKISIPSPVSGLVINVTDNTVFVIQPSNHRPANFAPTAILLPENERPPEPVSSVVGPICDFCINNFDYIYRYNRDRDPKKGKQQIEGYKNDEYQIVNANSPAWGSKPKPRKFWKFNYNNAL